MCQVPRNIRHDHHCMLRAGFHHNRHRPVLGGMDGTQPGSHNYPQITVTANGAATPTAPPLARGGRTRSNGSKKRRDDDLVV